MLMTVCYDAGAASRDYVSCWGPITELSALLKVSPFATRVLVLTSEFTRIHTPICVFITYKSTSDDITENIHVGLCTGARAVLRDSEMTVVNINITFCAFAYAEKYKT